MFARLPQQVALRQSILRRGFCSTPFRQLPELASTARDTPEPPYAVTRLVTLRNIKPSINPSQAPIRSRAPEPNVTSEPYTITRTRTRGMPTYELTKGGGTLKLTRVRRLAGEREVLKKDLEAYLMPKPDYVKINPVTGHIVVKGWYKIQIDKFLLEKGF